MKILLTGATGLIGSALGPVLLAAGHHVIELRRQAGASQETLAAWDLQSGIVDLSRCGPLDGVVHLAGETVAQWWTPAAKARIHDSRVRGTRILCEALAKMSQPPRVLLCASATGFYGNRSDEVLDERSAPGVGFLADVCREWEAAAAPARERGIRTVHLRLGIVLTPKGGALAKMLPAFRFGLGGPLGDGRQHWSWIALDDLLRVVLHALKDERLSGPVNVVTPHAMTNREFAAVLGAVLSRPTFLRIPAFAVRILFGEMGEETVLASAKVMPATLSQNGFVFAFPELAGALRRLLGARQDAA